MIYDRLLYGDLALDDLDGWTIRADVRDVRGDHWAYRLDIAKGFVAEARWLGVAVAFCEVQAKLTRSAYLFDPAAIEWSCTPFMLDLEGRET